MKALNWIALSAVSSYYGALLSLIPDQWFFRLNQQLCISLSFRNSSVAQIKCFWNDYTVFVDYSESIFCFFIESKAQFGACGKDVSDTTCLFQLLRHVVIWHTAWVNECETLLRTSAKIMVLFHRFCSFLHMTFVPPPFCLELEGRYKCSDHLYILWIKTKEWDRMKKQRLTSIDYWYLLQTNGLDLGHNQSWNGKRNGNTL